MPLYYLRRAGVDESDVHVIRFDTDIGKHGDTGRSELDAVQAVLAGDADVAAIGSQRGPRWARGADGRSLAEVWRTDGYCHCMFTALNTCRPTGTTPWLDSLLAMGWDNPEHRKILEMEGLRRWVRPAPGRLPAAVRGRQGAGHRPTMVILDLMRLVGSLAQGATAEIELCTLLGTATSPSGGASERQRGGTCDVNGQGAERSVRRGRAPDPADVLGADRLPGCGLWMYTNFHCNLACDYCCVASSPQTPRRELGAERIRRLADEAVAWGVHELFLTGGEPFLLPDIGRIVTDCATRLPTTVLTNAMVFKGRAPAHSTPAA